MGALVSPNVAVNAGMATAFNKNGKVGARAQLPLRLVTFSIMRNGKGGAKASPFFVHKGPPINIGPLVGDGC